MRNRNILIPLLMATALALVGSSGSRPTPSHAQSPRPEPGNGGRILVNAGFEHGFTGWNMDGVGDVRPTISREVVETGSRAGMVVLRGNQGRSELMLDGRGGPLGPGTIEFHEGDERYYAFSFLIRSMVYGHPGAHNLIMQFHSGNDAQFGLQLWNYPRRRNRPDPHRGVWSAGAAMGDDRFLSPAPMHKWNDVVIHFKASSTGAGFYEVYLNGKLIDKRHGVSMIHPGDTSGYIKTGLYRNAAQIPGTSQLQLDSARLGTTMKQVTVR